MDALPQCYDVPVSDFQRCLDRRHMITLGAHKHKRHCVCVLKSSIGELLLTPGSGLARLFALVGSWLETHDQDRDGLPNVVFDVVMLDNDLADVDIKLQFTEAQYLAEDPAGEIEAFGGIWSFVPFELWVAESGEVTGHGL
ncbi:MULTISPECIES: phage tail protein [Pseudomonas syringae group]|uniref:phage tail protein n=1 Tax=Pseudomonas syringae group TaxID=136849 RepID=UPI001D0C966C|nr:MULTISPECIES: phage tail protein [Pseudomonas syringae group]